MKWLLLLILLSISSIANGLEVGGGDGGGSGSVTSVGTSSPLAGGPITTTGTVTCSTCLTTSSATTNVGSTHTVSTACAAGYTRIEIGRAHV